jgi:hypothetical protein
LARFAEPGSACAPVLKAMAKSLQSDHSTVSQIVRNAKTYTCQALPDSTIDGTAVANYRTHITLRALPVFKVVGVVILRMT